MDVEKWEADMRQVLEQSSPMARHTMLAAMMAHHVRPGPSTDIYSVERNRFNPMAGPMAPAFEAAMQRLIAEFG